MSGPQVTIAQGTLLGKVWTKENGKVYHSYSGIPYAKPPVGNLRFKPPEKPESWTGVRDATVQGNHCRSVIMLLNKIAGDEDCLFLNVYVPQTSSDKPLPVMFWVHGGGFVCGSGNIEFNGPEYLMDYDVILVTINYRLGPLGFLSLDLEEAPGNVGLMDQVAALRWTKENIADFGGDSDNITIFGCSAGGASIHFLLLTDTTRGLFHKAISHSGSALNPWALQRNHVQRAYELCEKLGHPTNDPKDCLDFLRQAPVDQLISTKLSTEYEDNFFVNELIFVPTIEKVFPGHEPFLSESALAKMEAGDFHKVPFIAGFTNGEGIMYMMDIGRDPELFKKCDEDFERFIPRDLGLELGSEKSLEVASLIRKHYYGDEKVSGDNKEIFVKLLGDTTFVRGIDKMVRLTAEKSDEPVYYYEFCCDEVGIFKDMVKASDLKGANHGCDCEYIFTNELGKLPLDKPSVERTQKRILTMWTDFARTGNPTPEITDLIPVKWLPVSKENLNYLSFDLELKMDTDPEKESLEFWDKLVKEKNLQLYNM